MSLYSLLWLLQQHKRFSESGLGTQSTYITGGSVRRFILLRFQHANFYPNGISIIYIKNSTPTTTATIPYIKGTSETIARILQPYNIRVDHRPITTLRHLLTNVKDKDEPKNRQGAVYKIKCFDCQASYIRETPDRNLKTRLTEHKRATRNGDVNNHIAEHHRLTNHTINWDSAQCVTYSTNYFQRLTLESWFTNLEQTPLNRCQHRDQHPTNDLFTTST